MEEVRIIGLLIHDRIKESGKTQGVLTKYAHVIKSRLGFHEVTEAVCSRHGIVVLNLAGKREDCDMLENELSEIGGVEMQRMFFDLSKR